MIVPRLIILAASAAVAAIALVVVASGTSAIAASSLLNGNFETGDLTGWTVDTTASGGDARAVARYDYCPTGECLDETSTGIFTMLPQEGSYFALLTPGNESEDTMISQPFEASNGDRVSGWAFFIAHDSYYPDFWPHDDKGQVVVTSDSGTTVAIPFEQSVSSLGYDGPRETGWKYWEYTFTEAGKFQIEARVHNVGSSWDHSVIGLDDVKISTLGPDTTKPSTTATVSPQPNSFGWNNESVTVKLNATDNEGGWGVKEITYRINGGQPTTKPVERQGDSVEVPVKDEGENTIAYYATDKAGNVEDEQSLNNVKIDKTALTVKSTSPADKGRLSADKISATFLEIAGIDPSTLITNTFQVYQVTRSGDVSVSGTISFDEASQTVTFTPSGTLAKGTYRATITTGVEDKADNALANDYTWSFRK
jgi:hypothetical protein